MVWNSRTRPAVLCSVYVHSLQKTGKRGRWSGRRQPFFPSASATPCGRQSSSNTQVFILSTGTHTHTHKKSSLAVVASQFICTLQVYRSEEHTTSVHVYPFFSFVELLFRTQKCVCVAKMKQVRMQQLSQGEDLKF